MISLFLAPQSLSMLPFPQPTNVSPSGNPTVVAWVEAVGRGRSRCRDAENFSLAFLLLEPWLNR